MTDARADLVGRTLAGKYRVVRPLGQGGMGVVYEAMQEDVKRRVALKVMFDDDEGSLARFRQEARSMAAVSHPNVAAVLDFRNEPGEPPFFALELVEGRALSTVLRNEHRLARDRAVHIATQILDALDAAHRVGVIHRDVKPGNVMLGAHDTVKLVDFGIAKVVEDESIKTTTGMILGTPAYLAPEQLLGQAVDARTDVFAVGLVLYEMLTGKRARHDRAPPADDVPADVYPAIARALEPRPEDRFASAREMRAALLRSPVPVAAPKRSPLLRVVAIALAIAIPSSAALVALHLKKSATPAIADAAPAPSATESATIEEEADAAIEEVLLDASTSRAPVSTVKGPALNDNCFCRELRSDGYHQPLCLTPMKQICRCVTPGVGQLICPTKFEHGGSCPQRTLPEGVGKDGEPCAGFYDLPSGGIVGVKGELECNWCRGNLAPTRAVHGSRCTGNGVDGKRRPGYFICAGLPLPRN